LTAPGRFYIIYSTQTNEDLEVPQFQKGDKVIRIQGDFRGTKKGGVYLVKNHEDFDYLYLCDTEGNDLSAYTYDESKFKLYIEAAKTYPPVGVETTEISLDEAVRNCKDIYAQIKELEQQAMVYNLIMQKAGIKFI
jgi:hypothetical protein